MLPAHILTADILDIIFEGREKEYGAYVLRKGYNRRLKTAMLLTAIVVAIIIVVGWIADKKDDYVSRVFESGSTVLTNAEVSPPIVPKPLKPVKPVPRHPAPPPLPSRSINYMIVRDDLVKDEHLSSLPELPAYNPHPVPGNEINGDGQPNIGNTTGTDSAHAENSGSNHSFPSATESEYPGGAKAWIRFLIKELRFPLSEEPISGTVVVRFIVDEYGNVSDVKAISGPPELMQEAERVIKKSGKWTPGEQNGRKVKTYKKQPITFRISE